MGFFDVFLIGKIKQKNQETLVNKGVSTVHPSKSSG